MSEKGQLYLIPSPLGDNDPAEVIPAPVLERLRTLGTFVVEELRTARRYLSRAGLKGHIEELEFHVLNEHTPASEIEAMAALFDDGRDVGLITEAGLPFWRHPSGDEGAFARFLFSAYRKQGRLRSSWVCGAY